MERSGKTNILQSLFFIFLILLAGFVFLHSSFFEIRQITVKGNHFLKKEEIIELSGLTLGTNIFKQNFQRAAERIELHPIVKKAELARHFPSRVEINVFERRPIALIPSSQGFILVDGEGFYLRKTTMTGQENLPFITGISPVKGSPGEKISSPGLAGALSYLSKMPQALKDQVSEINGADENGLVLFTVKGIPVKLGDTVRIQEKLLILQQLLSREGAAQIEYFDLSIKKPVIKYLESERPGEE